VPGCNGGAAAFANGQGNAKAELNKLLRGGRIASVKK
jgi:hypothetical protein